MTFKIKTVQCFKLSPVMGLVGAEACLAKYDSFL